MAKIVYCNITYQCNNSCKNCISHNVRRHSSKQVNIDDYKFFQQKFNIGNDDIWTISGGEPTLSQDFEEIIAFCYQWSSHITVYSNGRNLLSLSRDTIDKIERIIVPLYGEQILHNNYVRDNNAYSQTILSLRTIILTNPDKIELKLMLDESSHNIERLMKTDEWNVLLNNRHFTVTRILSETRQLPSQELVDRAEQVIKYLINHHKNVKFYDIPFCMLSKEFQHLLSKMSIFVNKYEHNVICGGAGAKYILFKFDTHSDYKHNCEGCEHSIYCTMIMKNYFCPEINTNGIEIKYE